MPSTYSPSLKLELIGTGEQAGTWGTTTNNNLGTLLEQAITGVVTLNMGDANYTMTNYNGLSDEARNAVLVLNGPITSPQNLIAPPQQKVYIVRNFTGNTVTIRTATGNGTALTNAASAVVFCDGTDFYSATTLNYIDGNLTVTGNASIYGSVSMANTANSTVTIGGQVTANSDVIGSNNTGQWYLPRGTTTQRNNASPVNGLIRYNSTGNFFEGYANSTWIKFVTQNQAGYNIDYVVVGGGGSSWYGPNGVGGGGGGGGASISSTFVIQGSTVFNITVGGGGAGSSGTASSITGIATGGGGGFNPVDSTGAGAASGNGNPGAPNQGNGQSGGGGGSGGQATSANGGPGSSTLITGVQTFYGGGGGGGSVGGFSTPGGGSGGSGGGGNGGSGNNGGPATPPTNGGTNTGGGGGGPVGGAIGYGGSGIVILRFETAYYSGVTTGSPTVSTSGGYTFLTYSSSGTYTV